MVGHLDKSARAITDTIPSVVTSPKNILKFIVKLRSGGVTLMLVAEYEYSMVWPMTTVFVPHNMY
jgi:hypothetical protein